MKKFLILVLILSACSARQTTTRADFSYWEGHYQWQIRNDSTSQDLELSLKANGRALMGIRDYRDAGRVKIFKTKALVHQSGQLILPFEEDTFKIDSTWYYHSNQCNNCGPLENLNQKTDLNNTHWQLTIMPGYNLVEHGGRALSLGISADTLFGGFAGCNHFGGTLKIDSSGLFEIIEMNSTLLYCEPMDLEESYHANLRKVRSYRSEMPQRLRLLDSNGNALLYYDRKTILED